MYVFQFGVLDKGSYLEVGYVTMMGVYSSTAELRATVPLLVISLQQREVKTELVNFFKCIKYQ